MSLTVSVALCTHNGAQYLEQQLRSILAQRLRPLEVVVSDDASTDDTVQIVRRIWDELPDAPRLVLLSNHKALGVTANFEQAVSACTGELIALSDQDDVWQPERLEVIAAKFQSRPGLRLVFSDARLVSGAGSPLETSLFEALEISPRDLEAVRSDEAFATLLRRNLVTGATTVFRRSLLDAALPLDRAWVHDEWLAVVAAATGEVDWVPDLLIDYRQHGANQIGVTAPTLRYKVSRVFESRGERNRSLALRASRLLERIETLGVSPRFADLVRQKFEFESFRADLPPSRLRRIAPVLSLARSGRYQRFASRGRADILRDLLQPV